MKHPKAWAGAGEGRSPFRAILGNTAMLVGGRGVTGVLSLVYVALAARSLGVEGFGLLILVHTYAQTIGDFVEFNSWQTVLHYGVRPLRDGRTADLFRVIRFAMLLDALGAAGGAAVAILLAFLFAGPLGLPAEVLTPAMLYATSILFMSSTTPLGTLRLMDRFDLVAVQTTISSITRFAGSLVVFALGGGLGWWLAVWYLSTLAAFLFMVGAAIRVMRGHAGRGQRFLALAGLRPFTRDMPGAWAFVWNINVSSSLGLVTNKIALLAVGLYLGPREAAFFRIAKQLADGATRPAKLLVPALYPELAKLWLEGDVRRLTRLCLQIAATAGLVATSVLLVLALFGGPLITLFVGPDFLGATAIMLWLFGASVVAIWALPLEPLLISTGRSGSALRVRAAIAVLYLGAVFPLMDRLGLAGAGIAALAAAVLQMALQLLAVIRAAPGTSNAAAPAPDELALPSRPTLDNGPAIQRGGIPADGMNEHKQSPSTEATAGPATLTQALEAAAATDGSLDFHSGKGVLVESLGYARLRDEARALARRLAALGLPPGARVAILAETDADFPRAFFACRYAGLVPAPMPLPAAFGGREAYLDHLRRMLDVAEAGAALGPASLKDWLEEAVAGRGLAFAGTLADLPEAAEAAPELPAPAGADDLAYLQFSSGSTRFPMGVAVTEKALAANALAIIRHGLKVRDGDRCVSWLPFYHDMGLVGFCLVPVFAKLSVDYLATRDFARRPLLWLDLLSRNRGTISYAPSFGYDLCVRRLGSGAVPEGLDLSAWRAAGIGGDMIRPEILDRFAGAFAPAGFGSDRFVASYGMAETVLALSFAPLETGIRADRLDLSRLERDGTASAPADGAASRAFVRCGPALPGHALEVRGEDGTVLPEGRIGRIFAAGPSMMEGYYRNAEASEAVLTAGWLDTGDLGYVAGGEIVVTGRAKDLIIVNGRNIWPQDLELTAEAEVEGLRSGDVAAFSLDSAGEERVVVLVECRPSDPDVRARLAEAVEKTLRARHGVDVAVALVKPNALPLTSSGKLSRTKARELYRRMLDEAAPGSGSPLA